MGFLMPDIDIPEAPDLSTLRPEIPKAPERTPVRLRRPSPSGVSQLAAQTRGTRQLSGGPVSNLNIPLFS